MTQARDFVSLDYGGVRENGRSGHIQMYITSKAHETIDRLWDYTQRVRELRITIVFFSEAPD